MSLVDFPPLRPVVPPVDTTKPCIRCRHSQHHGALARMFVRDAVADETCEHPGVRQPHVDAVTGRTERGIAVPCHSARHFGEPCGPDARLFEPRGGATIPSKATP
jgi:hypothetical protein